MIITDRLDIKVGPSTVEHYKNLGYIFKMLKTTINIPVEHLVGFSKYLIDVKCDICGNERKLKYKIYYKNTKKLTDKYYCQKCKKIKTNQTILDKFDVDSIFHHKETKNKIKETIIKKYGVENVFKNNDIKNKIKNTNLKKYGVICVLQNNEINKKTKQTNLKKYGFENCHQSEIIKEKTKKTNLKKYGVNHSLQCEEIKNKIKITRINNNNQIPDDKLSDFMKYKNNVLRETYKNKKMLFEKWDGFDYYDNEYIKDNLNLNKYHRNYPTIDHKDSIFYGFINNISPIEISNLSNLCFTKRFTNGSKNRKTENQYKIFINENL